MIDNSINNIKRGIEDKDRTNKNIKKIVNETEENRQKNAEEIGSKRTAGAVNYGQESKLFFENLEWLTTAEAAIFLRKFCPQGMPSLNAVHKLVSQGKIRRRKFAGRLYFKKKELSNLIESSVA